MKCPAVLAVVLLAGPVFGATLYVGPGGFASIQSAIEAASSGDQIIVAAGTYYENIDFLGKAVTVRSTDPNDPNIIAATVIDGSRPRDPNSNTLVTFKSGEGPASILRGFTLQNGTGSWLLVAWKYKTQYWNRVGGAILCTNMSAPTIIGNRFISNRAGEGGAIYIYGNPVNPNNPTDPPVHVAPLIQNNHFESNSAIIEHGFPPPNIAHPAYAHGDGGALVAFQGADPLIIGNTFLRNHADAYGGAIHIRQWSHGILSDNLIADNDSILGAGVHLTYWSSPIIQRNTVRNNIAGNMGGGGIYVYYESAPVIEQNLIYRNTSTNGAGIGVYYGSSPLIRNNFITQNFGQGILLTGGSVVNVTCNTIADNTTDGIICQPDTSGSIANNIISGNGYYGIRVQTSMPLTITYNNVHGNSLGRYGPSSSDLTGTSGNISQPPSFLGAGNYHLSYNSPCVSAADPAVTGQGLLDIDGHPRRMGSRLDIGADEVMPVWNLTSGASHMTIQQAIVYANDGDTIALIRDTFTGAGNCDIDFAGKALTLTGPDAKNLAAIAQTIIDAQGSLSSPRRAFRFHSGEGSSSFVTGVTITGGAGYDEGGAVLCENAGPKFVNCIITGNSALISGGAIAAISGSNVTLINCVVAANIAGSSGGAIYAADSDSTVTNCTILGNKAADYGGAIAVGYAADVIARNCIIRQNRASQGAQLALLPASASSLMVLTGNIEGGAEAVLVAPGCTLNWPAGSIDADSLFVSDGQWLSDDTYSIGNWHITPASPCKDSGSLPVVGAADIDGEPRKFGSSVDMGADELHTKIADINTDGIVDWLDIAAVAEGWLTAAPDISGDGFSDFTDLALLATDWLWLAPWHPAVP